VKRACLDDEQNQSFAIGQQLPSTSSMDEAQTLLLKY
jgi:hypothetical protein